MHSRPLPGTNRALWYDWARFNKDRFTDYLLWVSSVIRKLDPSVPLAAGGSSSMLAGRTGTTGIDEERIVNEVDDVIIHEGGGSTIGVDLQLALSEKKKPLADPGNVLQLRRETCSHISFTAKPSCSFTTGRHNRRTSSSATTVVPGP